MGQPFAQGWKSNHCKLCCIDRCFQWPVYPYPYIIQQRYFKFHKNRKWKVSPGSPYPIWNVLPSKHETLAQRWFTDGSIVSTGACNLRIPVGPDICHHGWAHTVIQTVQRPGVYSAAYGTVHYKEPLKSFEIRVGYCSGFLLSRFCHDCAPDCAENDVKQYSRWANGKPTSHVCWV